MVKIEGRLVEVFWIVRNEDNSVIRFGVVPVGGVVESGLTIQEEFTTIETRNVRLLELGIDLE